MFKTSRNSGFNQLTHPWLTPATKAVLAGLTATVGTLGLGLMRTQPSIPQPPATPLPPVCSLPGGFWCTHPSTPLPTPPIPTDYTPLVITALFTGIFIAAVGYFSGACGSQEEKIENNNQPHKASGGSGKVSSDLVIEPKEDIHAKKTTYSDADFKELLSAYKKDLEEVLEIHKKGKYLSYKDRCDRFFRNLSDYTDQQADLFITSFFEILVSQLNSRSSRINLLKEANSSLKNKHPNSACKLIMKIEPSDIYPASKSSNDGSIAQHYLDLVKSAAKLDLNDENKERYCAWLDRIQKTPFEPACKWNYSDTPEEVLEQITNDFKTGKELTGQTSQQIKDIANYLCSFCPENQKQTFCDIVNGMHSKISDNCGTRSDSLTKNEEKMANELSDLIANIINEENDSELLTPMTIEVFNKFVAISPLRKPAEKIAGACVGRNEFDQIIEYVYQHSKDNFTIICLERADDSTKHKEMAEKIWDDTCRQEYLYSQGYYKQVYLMRQEYLSKCSSIHNKFSQNKLKEVLIDYYDKKIVPEDFKSIAENCAKNLLTKEDKISQINKELAIVGCETDLLTENFMQATNCTKKGEFIELLVKAIEKPTDIFTRDQATLFLKRLHKDDGSNRELILETCKKNSNPQVIKFLKYDLLGIIQHYSYQQHMIPSDIPRNERLTQRYFDADIARLEEEINNLEQTEKLKSQEKLQNEAEESQPDSCRLRLSI